MLKEVALIIAAYLLGSIPWGYLISKTFSGKDVLKVGWAKNSSSNVIKNVGLWQGLLTFALDVGKGFLAVFLAQKLGAGVAIQVVCGIAAVIGHNWSLFIKFRGGRGLAALIGALLAISPVALVVSLIPCLIFTIIWTAAIGTLLSFLAGIIFSFSFPPYFPAGFLLLFSLFPVLLKRLSPLKEIIAHPDREIIENRLVFDQDGVPPIRIKLKKKKKE